MLNLLNSLRKRDKMLNTSHILSLFPNSFNTCIQARLYTELRIQKLCDSFYPAFVTLFLRFSLKSRNQSHFPHEQWLNRRLFTVRILTLQFLANALAPERRSFWNCSALFDLFLYPGIRAVGAKSRVPNNQNASYTHRAREVARCLANRGHIGIRSTMNNKLNAITCSVWHYP